MILVASGCIIISTIALPLGPQAIVTGILVVISLTPVGSLSLILFSAFRVPLTAAINCCCISTHFAQDLPSGSLGVRIGISLLAHWDITNYSRLRSTGVIMLLLFVFAFSLSRCSHKGHVIIHGIVKFGTDHLLEAFLKAIEQMIPDMPSCFHFRDYLDA